MSATSDAPPRDDDLEDTRIMTVADVLNALDSLKGEVGGHAAAVADLLAQQEAAKAARHEARQELLRRLREEPHKFDFFQAVRLLEAAHPGLPRVGTSLRLRDDPIRFAQSPSLSFAPATLSSFSAGEGDAPPTLTQRFFGLFGANGPLPLHLTDTHGNARGACPRTAPWCAFWTCSTIACSRCCTAPGPRPSPR